MFGYRLDMVTTARKPVVVEVSPSSAVLLREVETPLGPMLAGAVGEGLCLLEFLDRPNLPRERADVRRLFGSEPVYEGDAPKGGEADRARAHLAQVERELGEYFGGTRTRFDVPLAIRGTAWDRAVWDQLLAIPHGETRSYEDIAVALSVRGAVRAVGLANGRNRIAIVIPCHRVIRKGGALGGYGGGLERKEYLLGLERGRRVRA